MIKDDYNVRKDDGTTLRKRRKNRFGREDDFRPHLRMIYHQRPMSNFRA